MIERIVPDLEKTKNIKNWLEWLGLGKELL